MAGPSFEQPPTISRRRTGAARAPSGSTLKPARQRTKAPNYLLKEAIRRSGMSYGHLAIEINQMAEAEDYRQGWSNHISTSRQRVGHWVNDGEQPQKPVPRYIAAILTKTLGLTRPLTPTDLGFKEAAGLPSGMPDLTALGATPEEARTYARTAATTDLKPGDLEDLELSVHQLAASYSTKPLGELWVEVDRYRKRAHSLLTHCRHTLREGRDLTRHAGMLSIILAWVAHDLGENDLVQAYCDDAWAQGMEAEALDVCAWSEDVRCTHSLYAGRPYDAFAAATRGLSVAPPQARIALRLTAQLARVNARLNNHSAFTDVMTRVRPHSEQLPLHRSGLFGLDAAVLASYEASSRIWLGDHQEAVTAAQIAIECYQAMPRPQLAPTRLAIAHLDLALAHTALGDPEQAVAAARHALAGNRIVDSVRRRSEHLEHRLQLRYPELRAVRDFSGELHDQLSPDSSAPRSA
ncbi:hypothetical protein OG413_40440 [Streptomyces sp. NBC_01433]|uniref:hypothetical protein n=1 Tax=Streptomyces sp. NBC_01433 TaxID=2903864 RepID=UPI00225ACC6E|nr:hypothetical protein [Streptomyces sp. NBC_01433]MCX4681470.1 hypothetical protein [Streptomyces sp. NBC_01433]